MQTGFGGFAKNSSLAKEIMSNFEDNHPMTFDDAMTGMRKICNILVVDNDSVCLAIVSRFLRLLGHTVSTAETAEEAFSTISSKESEFKLILAEFNLPGMEGFEFLKKMKKISNLPIVVLSADTRHTSKLKALRKWVELYYEKPGDIYQLQYLWFTGLRKSTLNKSYVEDSEDEEDTGCLSYLPESEFVDGETVVTQESIRPTGKRANRVEEEEVDSDSVAPKRPKPSWNNELHGLFLQAVRVLGMDAAEPEEVRRIMNVQGLTRASVLRHWQHWKENRLFVARKRANMAAENYVPGSETEIATNMELLEGSGDNNVVSHYNGVDQQPVDEERRQIPPAPPPSPADTNRLYYVV